MPRCEHGHDQLCGDQAPSQVVDESEVEPPVLKREGDREADDLGEVPQIVLEDRAAYSLGQAETGLTADIGPGEHRTGSSRRGGEHTDRGHRVASSGRSGSSSSQPPALAAAAAKTTGSNRSRTSPIRWEY